MPEPSLDSDPAAISSTLTAPQTHTRSFFIREKRLNQYILVLREEEAMSETRCPHISPA